MQEERDDIEKFFAKRLGEKDFPFEEEQWETLAKRLDDESPVKPPFWLRFRRKIGYILIPIITFLIGWYLQRGTEEVMPVETLPTVPQQEIPQKSARPSAEELNPQEEPTQELKEKAGKPQTVELGSVSSATERTAMIEKKEKVASELREEKRRDGEAGLEIPPIGLRNRVTYLSRRT